jgi:hypothetical protein
MRLRIAFAVVLLSAVAESSARQTSDWSGRWTSQSGQDVRVIRNVHGTGSARGWDTYVDALKASRDYLLSIEPTATGVAVMFPGGDKNMLTTPPFAFGEGRETVVNRGDWWTKHVASARWIGAALELDSLSFSGWWKNGGPEAAQPKPTDYRKRLTLNAGPSSDELLLRVELADEKGVLVYEQTFTRAK